MLSTRKKADDIIYHLAEFNKGNTELNLGNKENALTHWKMAYSLGAQYALERINNPNR